MPDAKQASARPVLRRIPKQERSRDRIDEILKVAMDLIGQKGIDAVTMKEIAALSGGPIASVYQYFPNKSAIIAMLYDRYIANVTQFMTLGLSDVRGPDDICRATDAMIDLYNLYVQGNPQIQDLINAIQADKMLGDMDLTESRRLADLFADATDQYIPEALRAQYRRTTFMMCNLTVSAVRMALKAQPEEAKEIIAAFKLSTRAQVSLFLDGSYASH
ncbi:TetR family transcriptional regulator [Rhizobium sp. SGZ-381]|uniref:TetR family transcriptional regulator n=1 Tax=Rhizobium sp. SGZ-381 TaxID=3342800 RepID=UPI003670AC2F